MEKVNAIRDTGNGTVRRQRYGRPIMKANGNGERWAPGRDAGRRRTARGQRGGSPGGVG